MKENIVKKPAEVKPSKFEDMRQEHERRRICVFTTLVRTVLCVYELSSLGLVYDLSS